MLAWSVPVLADSPSLPRMTRTSVARKYGHVSFCAFGYAGSFEITFRPRSVALRVLGRTDDVDRALASQQEPLGVLDQGFTAHLEDETAAGGVVGRRRRRGR